MRRFLFLILILFFTVTVFASALKNLNTALPAELIEKGVPENIISTVLAYREQLNGFNSIEDLKRIPGVNAGIFETIQNNFFVPAAAEYRIYAGDAIEINILDKHESAVVSPDGYIYVTEHGRFHIAGLTVLGAQELLSQKIDDVSVSLGRVSFKVAVIVAPGVSGSGKLVEPGKLSQICAQVNVGSKAKYKVRVMRVNQFRQPGGDYETFDLAKLNHLDPFIQNGDVVFVDERGIWKVADTITECFSILFSPLRAVGEWLGIAAKTGI